MVDDAWLRNLKTDDVLRIKDLEVARRDAPTVSRQKTTSNHLFVSVRL